MKSVKRSLIRRTVPNHHAGNFLNWEQVHTIALLLDDTLPVNRHAVDKWIAKSGRSVDVYFCEPKAKVATYADWQCYTRKEKSVSGLPKRNVLPAKMQYDVLINATSDNVFASAIARAIKASCKTGTELDSVYGPDIVIDRNYPQVEKYLDDVLHYLQMIRPAASRNTG